jgi:hypothetical protein
MKSTLQKCYEKNGNGINVTPVAIMLDQERINSLNPDWIYSKKIYKVIEDATRIDKRTKVGDFAGQFIMIDELFDKADF